MVVIHYTGMPSTAAALDRLCDPVAEVSAHYLISEQGEILPLVPEDLRAWHAGAGGWGGVRDVNSSSIGVELANTGTTPFAAAQMAALEGLLSGILSRWPIPPERVIAHSDMAPLRKADPGPRFDWRRLALRGLSVWPGDAPPEYTDTTTTSVTVGATTTDFLAALAIFGYDAALPQDVLLRAFRLRFRPWATGPADLIDAALATDLARRFPVDRGAPQA